MIRYKTCIRCESENVDILSVNSPLRLNYPEERRRNSIVINQRIISPTDTIVCKECGHIEFFIDWQR